MHEKQKVKNVHSAINDDLEGYVRICDTDQFLGRILPVMMVEDILKRVQENKLYSGEEKRWSAFPNKPKKEIDLYEPFISTAEGIRAAIPEDQVKVQGVWLDRHDLSPKTSDEDLADARPDCLFVPQLNAVRQLDNTIRSLEKESSNSDPEQNTKKKQLVKFCAEPIVCLNNNHRFRTKNWEFGGVEFMSPSKSRGIRLGKPFATP